MAEDKRLRRPLEGRVLAGVCAGLGKYFEVDPVVVRVIFALLAWFGGGGLLAYVVLWIVMPPEEPGV